MDEFLLVLMRLTASLFVHELVDRLCISISSVCRICITWTFFFTLNYLIYFHFHLKSLYKEHPLRNVHFVTTKIILDCTELFIQRPSALLAQSHVPHVNCLQIKEKWHRSEYWKESRLWFILWVILWLILWFRYNSLIEAGWTWIQAGKVLALSILQWSGEDCTQYELLSIVICSRKMVYSTPNKTRKQQAKQYKMDHTGWQILDCHQHLQLFTKLLVATWYDARAKIKFNIHVRSTQGKAVLHKLSQDLQSVLEV